MIPGLKVIYFERKIETDYDDDIEYGSDEEPSEEEYTSDEVDIDDEDESS